MAWLSYPFTSSSYALIAALPPLVLATGMSYANPPTPAERHLVASGSRILQRFPSEGGMTAVVADNGREKRLFYVTPDGRALVAGLLFDAAGNNVTDRDLARAGVGNTVNAVSPAVAGKVWQQAQELDVLQDGRGGPTVFAFVDPTCPYSRALMRKVRPLIASGRLTVRWVPIAILSRSSYGLAQTMYEAKSVARSVTDLAEDRLPPRPETARVRSILERNVAVARQTGITAVPILVYRGQGRVVVTSGVPTDAEIAAILDGPN